MGLQTAALQCDVRRIREEDRDGQKEEGGRRNAKT